MTEGLVTEKLVDEDKLKNAMAYLQLVESAIDFERKAKRVRENLLFCKWIAKYLPTLTGDSEKDLIEILKGNNPFEDFLKM